MQSKKNLIHLCCGVIVFLGAAVLLVFLVDPFFHYHKPWFGLVNMGEDKEYQIPGILENYEYDSLLVGSSTAMSLDADRLNERFSCVTVKAVGNSAPAPQLNYYMDLAFEGHELKYVFYGLDVFSFYSDPDMQPVSEEVAYLTNKNPFDDVQYFWNMDVIGEKVPEMLRSDPENAPEGLLYAFNRGSQTGPESVLVNHTPGNVMEPKAKPLDYQAKYVTGNIARLETKVREHPETQFLFFVPPYHIVWWDNAYEMGLLDTYLYTLETCMERLLSYDNVHFYRTDFNEELVITDVYQYMDYIHGSVEVTERMAEQIGTPEQEITLDNYLEEMEQFREVFARFRMRVEAEGYGFLWEHVNPI